MLSAALAGFKSLIDRRERAKVRCLRAKRLNCNLHAAPVGEAHDLLNRIDLLKLMQ